MSDPKDLALEILALVDSTPSELFSFERKQVENTITDMIYRYTQQVDHELDDAFALGVDEGRSQAESDFEQEIRELEEQLEEAKRDIEELTQDNERAYAEGYETAIKDMSQ